MMDWSWVQRGDWWYDMFVCVCVYTCVLTLVNVYPCASMDARERKINSAWTHPKHKEHSSAFLKHRPYKSVLILSQNRKRKWKPRPSKRVKGLKKVDKMSWGRKPGGCGLGRDILSSGERVGLRGFWGCVEKWNWNREVDGKKVWWSFVGEAGRLGLGVWKGLVRD